MSTRYVRRTSPRHAVHLIVATVTLLTLVAGCEQAKPTTTPKPTRVAIITLTPAPEPMVSVPPTRTATLAPSPIPATAVPAPETPTSTPGTTPDWSPTIADVMADLQGLPLDEFFEASYTQLLLRDPERLSSMGVAEKYGLGHDQLTDISDAYLRETQALEVAILDLLRAYDRAALGYEQQISYDVYEWYLEEQVRGHAFTHHRYWVNSFSFTGEQYRIIDFFTNEHPVTNAQNARNYVTRLSQTDVKLSQLLEQVKLSAQAGVIPPRFVIEHSIDQMRAHLNMRSSDPASIQPESLALYTAFEEKLNLLDDLSAEEKQILLEAALAAIETKFVPAYVALMDYLAGELLPRASDDAGAWKLPDGDAYYAHMLRQGTTTALSANQIHELGLAEVARLQAGIRATAEQLGYPAGESLEQLWDRVYQDCDTINLNAPGGQEKALAAFEAIISEADQATRDVFDVHPSAEVVVAPEPPGQGVGAYYASAPADGSRPPTFFINLGGSSLCPSLMARVAHHEAVPGHHFQISVAGELDLPTFRKDLSFNAYAEGWAVYAERLAWELDLYDDDPIGELGYLHGQLYLASRVVLDTGLHALGWTPEQGAAYVEETVGMPPGAFLSAMDRYVVWPGQATGYTVGQLKMLALRQAAIERLGDQFDLKEFHNVVLTNGSMPLEILERVVEDYIESKS